MSNSAGSKTVFQFLEGEESWSPASRPLGQHSRKAASCCPAWAHPRSAFDRISAGTAGGGGTGAAGAASVVAAAAAGIGYQTETNAQTETKRTTHLEDEMVFEDPGLGIGRTHVTP